MNKDDKLFNLMSKMYGEMQEGFNKVNSKIETIQSDITELKGNVQGLREGQTRIENKLDDIEAINADRHVLIGGELKDMKSDISRIELNTADNWKDIVRLKSIK